MPCFVGLDWASATHAVCVVDADGTVVTSFEIPHSAAGLRGLLSRLRQIAPEACLPVAIERPDGLLVDTLLRAGHPVVAIHPNVLKASRSRYRAAASKSDPGDAYILADLLRTDGHRFQPLKPHSDPMRALRALVRTRDDLVADRVALANRLCCLLESFWPGAAVIFNKIESPIALAFLQRYPCPATARRLGPKRLAAFLARNHYSGGRTAHELLERLRAAPTGQAGANEQQVKADLVLTLVTILDLVQQQIRTLSGQLQHAVAQIPSGRILMSLPRAGKINAAQILAELGDDPARFPSEDHLAAQAGVAPLTRASGKYRAVLFRFACNKRLRGAVTRFADNSRHASPWARDIYLRARQRGCSHPHAIRVLARAWIRVLWRCWHDQTPYDPARHGSLQHLLQSA